MNLTFKNQVNENKFKTLNTHSDLQATTPRNFLIACSLNFGVVTACNL